MALIAIGGLGFVVWSELLEFRRQRKLSLHTRVVLAGTAVMILSGACLLYTSKAIARAAQVIGGVQPAFAGCTAADAEHPAYNLSLIHIFRYRPRSSFIFWIFLGSA